MWGVLNYHGTRVRNGDHCVNISAGEALSTLSCHSLSLEAAPPEPGSQVCGRWGHSLHTVKQNTSAKRITIIPNWLESTIYIVYPTLRGAVFHYPDSVEDNRALC